MILSSLLVGWLVTNIGSVLGSNTFPNCIADTDAEFLCVRVKNGTNMRYYESGVVNDSVNIATSYVEIIYNGTVMKTTQSDYGIYAEYDDGICFENKYENTITFDVYDETNDMLLGSLIPENLATDASIEYSFYEPLTHGENSSIEWYEGQVAKISVTLWTTSESCVNLTKAVMPFADNYQINLTFIDIYWTSGFGWRIKDTVTYLTDWSGNTANPSWNELYCFSPTGNSYHFLATITVTRESTSQEYTVTDPLYSLNMFDSVASTVNETVTYTQYAAIKRNAMDNNTIDYTLSNGGHLYVEWIETCTEEKTDTSDDEGDDGSLSIDEVSAIIGLSTLTYSIIILTLGVVAILYSCWRVTTKFPASDPVNYLAVGWLILELWDFFSDIAFTVLLYFVWQEEGHLYFFFAVTFLGLPYLCNLYYMIHLLQIWNHPKAPGQTRHWLEMWSWYFIVIAMVSGGVHPALEITNSVLLPNEFFGMHLPYHEVVRVRSERFVTNVLVENIPHLILQVVYILSTIESAQYGYNSGGAQSFTLTATLISSGFSLFFSGIYYCIHSRQTKEAIATHAFSFTFSSVEFLPYMAHSHWKIQTAIQRGFQLHSPSQVIIDQCIPLIKAMKVEGRLMGDLTAVNRRISVAVHDRFSRQSSNDRAAAVSPQGAQTETGSDPQRDEQFLSKLRLKEVEIMSYLKKEFKLKYSNADDACSLSGLLVRVINGGRGETIYHHDTSAKTFCIRVGRCTQLCCYGLCHRCCPESMCRKPAKSRWVSSVSSTSPPPPPQNTGLNGGLPAINETPNGESGARGLKPFSTVETYENYGESEDNSGHYSQSPHGLNHFKKKPMQIDSVASNSVSIQSTPVIVSPSTPVSARSYGAGIPKTRAEAENEGKKNSKIGVNMLFADVVKEETHKKYMESNVTHEPNGLNEPTKFSERNVLAGMYNTPSGNNKNNKYGSGYDNDTIDTALDNDNLRRLNSEKETREGIPKLNGNSKNETIEDKYEQMLKARRISDDNEDVADERNDFFNRPKKSFGSDNNNNNNNKNNNDNSSNNNSNNNQKSSHKKWGSSSSVKKSNSNVESSSGQSVTSVKNMWESKASPRNGPASPPAPTKRGRPPPPPPKKNLW